MTSQISPDVSPRLAILAFNHQTPAVQISLGDGERPRCCALAARVENIVDLEPVHRRLVSHGYDMLRLRFRSQMRIVTLAKNGMGGRLNNCHWLSTYQLGASSPSKAIFWPQLPFFNKHDVFVFIVVSVAPMRPWGGTNMASGSGRANDDLFRWHSIVCGGPRRHIDENNSDQPSFEHSLLRFDAVGCIWWVQKIMTALVSLFPRHY